MSEILIFSVLITPKKPSKNNPKKIHSARIFLRFLPLRDSSYYSKEELPMMRNQQFDERYLAFGAEILKFVSLLPRTMACRHIADQLFRSGTSVGAHLQEARAAESRADFVHKFQIALKEMRETGYWLSLIEKAQLIPETSSAPLMKSCEELTAILAKSVITAKRNSGVSVVTSTVNHV